MNFLIILLARLSRPLLAAIIVPISRLFMYISFGVLASISWLFHFLKKDVLAEPAKAILRIFFWGMLITLPVFLLELGFSKIISQLTLPPIFVSFFYWFCAIALIEEVFKYLVVRVKIVKTHEFDEPVDAMIYMIVAALGFAALENILYLLPSAEQIFSPTLAESLTRTATISFFRFIGATFLHALCSGLVGFFLAISISKNKKTGLTFLGLVFAILLHGLYNFSIMEIEMPLKFIIPTAMLLGLFIFVTLCFRTLKKMKSMCKI